MRKVRTNWPVAEIPDAGHNNCIAKPQFREVNAAWLKQNSK
jgi:hypothetical protein